MRKALSSLILRLDPNEQLKEAERFVKQGELKEFLVGDEVIAFIDTKGDPKREAVLHLNTLHKLQGRMNLADFAGNKPEAALYKDAIERLQKIYPDMAGFEKLYLERESKMKERWGR